MKGCRMNKHRQFFLATILLAALALTPGLALNHRAAVSAQEQAGGGMDVVLSMEETRGFGSLMTAAVPQSGRPMTDALATSRFNLTGFAQAATGGGIVPETDPNYRKVFTAVDLQLAL